MRQRQVEVLAPAGSFESMKAAVAAGADAVYMGGSRFGARAYADNPDEKKLLEAIDYVHLHGATLYMTVNTLMKEQELEELEDYLKPFYCQGLDGVIVQDLGAAAYIREHFPGLPIHGSTQMTVTGVYGARMLKNMGIKRVVTARELSLEEIRRINREVPIEIESFVHGALCYCYSGQCLLSSLIGGRSGNRGRCAQPCRLPYEAGGKKGYFLSMKDLCTLDILPDLIEAGVCSLKIEGRMKSPRYTAGVTEVYRKHVDLYLEKGRQGYRVRPEDRQMLLDLFDRGGFTEGYYRQHNGADMIAVKEKPAFRQGNQELFDRLDRMYVEKEKKEPIEGILTVTEGERVSLRLRPAGRCVPLDFGSELEEEKFQKIGLNLTGRQEESAGQSRQGKRQPESARADAAERRPEAAGPNVVERQSGLTRLDEAERQPEAAGREPRTESDSGKEPAVRADKLWITVYGPLVDRAKNQPLTREQLARQMKKTGNTPFEFESLDICLEGQGFLPVQALNELRREGMGRLQEGILSPYRRQWADRGTQLETPITEEPGRPEPGWRQQPERTQRETPMAEEPEYREQPERTQPETPATKEPGRLKPEQREKTEPGTAETEYRKRTKSAENTERADRTERPAPRPTLHVLLTHLDQAPKLLQIPEVKEIIIEADGSGPETWKSQTARCHDHGKACVLAMPMIFRTHGERYFDRHLTLLKDAGFDAVLVRAWEEPEYLRKNGVNLPVYGDHNLYSFNSEAKRQLTALGCRRTTFPLELNGRELKRLGGEERELIGYGYLPAMVSAQCIQRTVAGCTGKPGRLMMKDRTGKELPVENHCAYCYNIIYNPTPLSLLDQRERIMELAPQAVRLLFTRESAEEIRQTVQAWVRELYDRGKDTGRETGALKHEFTRGHFKRGVE